MEAIQKVKSALEDFSSASGVIVAIFVSSQVLQISFIGLFLILLLLYHFVKTNLSIVLREKYHLWVFLFASTGLSFCATFILNSHFMEVLYYFLASTLYTLMMHFVVSRRVSLKISVSVSE